MENIFHRTFHDGCNYLSILGLKIVCINIFTLTTTEMLSSVYSPTSHSRRVFDNGPVTQGFSASLYGQQGNHFYEV